MAKDYYEKSRTAAEEAIALIVQAFEECAERRKVYEAAWSRATRWVGTIWRPPARAWHAAT